MNDKILCLYCSRTGLTRKLAERLAVKLNAELVEVTDGKDRSGARGYLAALLDAVRKNPPKVRRVQTRYSLPAYDKVILLTPIWAETCSSMARAFLMQYGKQLPADTSFVLTHMSTQTYDKVLTKMDSYLRRPHKADLSLSTKTFDPDEQEAALAEFAQAVRTLAF